MFKVCTIKCSVPCINERTMFKVSLLNLNTFNILTFLQIFKCTVIKGKIWGMSKQSKISKVNFFKLLTVLFYIKKECQNTMNNNHINVHFHDHVHVHLHDHVHVQFEIVKNVSCLYFLLRFTLLCVKPFFFSIFL